MQILAEFRDRNSNLDDCSIALFRVGGRFFPRYEYNGTQHWFVLVGHFEPGVTTTCQPALLTPALLGSHQHMKAYEENMC